MAAFYSAFPSLFFFGGPLSSFEEFSLIFCAFAQCTPRCTFVARFIGDAPKMLVGTAGTGGGRASGTPAWAPQAAGGHRVS